MLINRRFHMSNTKDTAGQETYHALGPIYYRDAHGSFRDIPHMLIPIGALLVYDITDEDSYLRIQEWIKELRSVLGPIPMVLAGNKSDLDSVSGNAPRTSRSTNERQRVVTVEEVQRYAKELNQKMPGIARDTGDTLDMATFVETSAKLNRNVDVAFVELAKRMQAIRNQQQQHSPIPGSYLARSVTSPVNAGSSPTRRSLVILDDQHRNQPSATMRSSHSRLASSSSTSDERSCCLIS